jgi:hypothetical protein
MHRCQSMALLACMIIAAASTAVAQSQGLASTSEPPLQEVTVTATRALGHKALAHAVSAFVQSHSAPGARINQIGRWDDNVCPLVTGLRPAFNDFVARKVLDVARGVGAPVQSVGKQCSVNVEIVFTPDPQALLDHIAKSYRILLGFYPASQVKQTTTFSHPIQAWYETGTQSFDYQLPIEGGRMGVYSPAALSEYGNPFNLGAQVDSAVTAAGWQPAGVATSRLGNGLRSTFLHVLIIADSHQVARYSLQSIADYAAMLSLTRMAQLENCAPLPSITDLLAGGCTTPVSDALTSADRAYLKALYAADLEQNLNLERGDVHERMMRQIETGK